MPVLHQTRARYFRRFDYVFFLPPPMHCTTC